MNCRERERVAIICFGYNFSTAMCVTNAPSMQMIEQLLGSPFVYQNHNLLFFGT